MIDPVYVAVAVFTIAASISLFMFRKVLYAVLALSAAFLGSALVFLYVDQVLIALLQLLVFVGGLSTYLLVAVAAEQKNMKLLSRFRFLIFALFLAVAFASLLLYTKSATQTSVNSFVDAAASSFQIYYALLFGVVILLFATTIGGLLVIKKFSKVIV